MTTTRTPLALLALIALSVSPAIARAAVPLVVVHEGILRDGGGAPITTTTTLTFALFDAPEGGDAFFTETIVVAPEADGSYRAVLGQGGALTSAVLDRSSAFLEVTAGSGAAAVTLGPRLPVAAVPYALRAGAADAADRAAVADTADRAGFADAATSADTATAADSAARSDLADRAAAADVASLALAVDDGAGGVLSFERLVALELCAAAGFLYLPGHSGADADGCLDESALDVATPLPVCAPGQVVSSDGTALSCVPGAPPLPACTGGQVLFSDGSGLSCVAGSPALPVCVPGQVLSSDGATVRCVADDTGASLPTCGAGQVLFSNGASLSCVAGSPALPVCTGTDVLTSTDGATLSCTPTGTPIIPSCPGGQLLTADGTDFSCVSITSQQILGIGDRLMNGMRPGQPAPAGLSSWPSALLCGFGSSASPLGQADKIYWASAIALNATNPQNDRVFYAQPGTASQVAVRRNGDTQRLSTDGSTDSCTDVATAPNAIAGLCAEGRCVF